MKTTKAPTIIYDTRKINKNDYPEGITMRDYFKLHTIQDFNKEFEKDESPTKTNYAVECMKLTRHILKNFENVIYLSRGLYLMDERCKISYDNGERSLTAENLRYGRKIFYLSNPSDYSGALLLAINHINNELTPDAYQQITQDLNIWY